MPDGKFPTEEWLRKRGRWADRPGEPYNTLSVYIKQWIGGVRKLRLLLDQEEASTIPLAGVRDEVPAANSTRMSMPPSGDPDAHARAQGHRTPSAGPCSDRWRLTGVCFARQRSA
jgi:hypothetical protein